MRFITSLLVLIICFGCGVFFGLMYKPHDDVSNAEQIEEEVIIEEIEEEISEEDSVEVVSNPIEEGTHPIEKVATVSEKVTTSFFDQILKVLSSISELFL